MSDSSPCSPAIEAIPSTAALLRPWPWRSRGIMITSAQSTFAPPSSKPRAIAPSMPAGRSATEPSHRTGTERARARTSSSSPTRPNWKSGASAVSRDQYSLRTSPWLLYSGIVSFVRSQAGSSRSGRSDAVAILTGGSWASDNVGAMSTDVATMDKIVSLCRRRGFVFPSSEIYGGLGSTYDYGHYGVLTKNNIRSRWFSSMVQERDDIVALDSAVILNPRVWEASGHVEGFTDPLVDCRTCKLRFRGDRLEDSQCGRKPSKKPGETSDCDLTEPRQFNLMFETSVGALVEGGSTAYLRPETAQGIFINFKNVLQLARRRPPFGIAQVGKSFRNEITPGNFLFRLREFEQMEMEFFVPPDDATRWHEYWIEARVGWYRGIGLRDSHLRVREHGPEGRSHYSLATRDIEYLYPIGWSELEGVANRGDFDLSRHTEFSTTKLEYVSPDGERYVPHVIEPAVSLERIIVAMLTDAYDEEVVGERERTVLHFHPEIAPVTAAILPLIAKDEGMVSKARGLYEDLRKRHSVEYDDNGAIGRRYRRQDEIGTPWALTIDEQTLADDTVTVRDRDTLAQERVSIDGVKHLLLERLEQPWHPRA